MAPVARLTMFMTLAFALVAWPVYLEARWSLVGVVANSLLMTGVFAVAAYFFFGLGEVRSVLRARMLRRTVPST
jgi:hypothetical protein